MATPTDVDRDAPVLTDLAIDINAPRDRVWKLHTDVNAWPMWQPDINDAAADEPLKPGATFSWSTYGMDITSTLYRLTKDLGSSGAARRTALQASMNGPSRTVPAAFTSRPPSPLPVRPPRPTP